MYYGLKINSYIDGPTNKLSSDQIGKFQEAMQQGDDPYSAFETNTLTVLDDIFNGDLRVQFILDSIAVEYSRIGRKMKALQRAFNSSMGKSASGVTVDSPEVGKPRKNGVIATLSVKFPLSDGQSITVVFHAPDGDPEKVTSDDTLISFRWLLNSRDVTAWMSPEADKDKLIDISLNTLGSRVSQLVEANTAKFTERQSSLAADKEALAAAQENKIAINNEIADLEDSIPSLTSNNEQTIELNNDIGRRIKEATDRNTELKKTLAALQASSEAKATQEESDAANSTRDEKPSSQIPSTMRSNMLKHIFKSVHKDFKGKLQDGTKTILVTGKDGGAESIPLSNLTDEQIKQKLGEDTWAAYHLNLKSGQGEGAASSLKLVNALNMTRSPYTSTEADLAEAITLLELVQSITDLPEAWTKSLKQSQKHLAKTQEVTVSPEQLSLDQLQSLINGEVTDTDEFDRILDEAADALEAEGLLEKHDDVLNQAADKLTELLIIEAEGL